MTKTEKLKELLEREFGAPLNEIAWRMLGGDGFLTLDPAREEHRARIVKRYRHVLGLVEGPSGQTDAKRPRKDEATRPDRVPFDVRMDFLAAVLTERANHDPTVLEFREKHLGGGTLEPEEVGPWLDETAAREKPPLLGGSRVTLWAPPYKEGEWLNRVIEAHDHGVIADLKRAVESSSGAEKWEFLGAETAVMRVLTGRMQTLPKAIVSVKPSSHTPALTTIMMQVNYRLTPRDVARIYQEARRRAGRTGRDRAMDPKSLWLAYYTQSYKPRRTWVQVQSIWNEAFPEWLYDTDDPRGFKPKQFARDCRDAYRRLTGAKMSERAETSAPGPDVEPKGGH